MNLPIPKDSTAGLILSAVFGLIFGVLLNKGRVTDYNVIVNLFRLKDFTVVKIMFTAIIVGGLGVFVMKGAGLIGEYQIKAADLLGVALGSAIFGVGMALLGYCPGTGVAAMATGRLHAVVGFFGMIAGGIVYAFSYTWIKANILSIGAMGKVRLSDVTGVPDIAWWVILVAIAAGVFYLLETKFKPSQEKI
ncbi:MAG: YeeE/YedE thiosulfate transporter family protein [Verrucomicrobiales bacterium]|nr:YeeE/YedE thiosulfate transporter family protein [Verrucomicrobiales bacterium]